jgi:serine/threonine-protein kinase
MTEEEQKGFAKFLVEEKRVVSPDDLQKCLELQQAMHQWGIDKPIDKVVVEKGLLDAPQVSVLLREYLGGDEDFIRGYRIIAKLGEGAMGEVYSALDLENDRRLVAIKVLFPYLSKRKAAAQRFLQEAQICIKKLDHPHIVKGYEVGYEVNNDCYFYVMELIHGKNLRKIFQEQGRFSEQMALDIMMQMASALEHAAQVSLVHRDIKPDNIMLTKSGEAKLCDLGLARDWGKDLSLTRTGAVMGTPFYISPEAAAGLEQLDCRSDIYSLGASMYHMVVGQVPFSGQNASVVLNRHISDPLVPPIEQCQGISHGFSVIIETMMAKAPRDRYQTPTALMEDIKKLQAGALPNALANNKGQQSVTPTVRKNKAPRVKEKTTELAALAVSKTEEFSYTGGDGNFDSDGMDEGLPAEAVTEEAAVNQISNPAEPPLRSSVQLAQAEVEDIVSAKTLQVEEMISAKMEAQRTGNRSEEDMVEEYMLGQKETLWTIPKQQKRGAILNTFLTSGERRVLSQAQNAKSKLLMMGAIMGGAALFGSLILGYIIWQIVKFFGK